MDVSDTTATPRASDSTATITPDRLKLFKAALLKLFQVEHAQSLTLDRIREFLGTELTGDNELDEAELLAAIDKMQDDNQIMMADNIVFLI